jgi:hypothetical protein
MERTTYEDRPMTTLEIAQDLTWMLCNTITDGDYATRPARALRIWETEMGTVLDQSQADEILNLIEW